MIEWIRVGDGVDSRVGGIMEQKRPQGRPRTQAAIERDERVLDVIKTRGSATRNELVDRLGEDPVLIYLSLRRLRARGLAVSKGHSTYTTWHLA